MCERVVWIAIWIDFAQGLPEGKAGRACFSLFPLDEEQDLKTDAPLE
jgi:hypothetical protein